MKQTTTKLISGMRVRALFHSKRDKQQQQADKLPKQRAASAGATVKVEEEESCCSSVVDDTNNTSGTVRFALNRTEYHDDTLRDMGSQAEWDSCWYDTASLKQFRTEQVQTTQNLFEDNFRLPPEQVAQAQEWKAVLVKAYEACRELGDSGVGDLEFVMAEALETLYAKASDTLVGLETNMLARIRGKAARQIRNILQTIREHHSQSKNDSEDGEHDDEACPKSISNLTLPSSHFAHQVAVAHAKALWSDEGNKVTPEEGSA